MKLLLLLLAVSMFFYGCDNFPKLRFAHFSDTHLGDHTSGADDLRLAGKYFDARLNGAMLVVCILAIIRG